MAIFSFPKWLPVPDGGALVVNNRQFAGAVRLAGPRPHQAGRSLLGLVRAWLVKAGLYGTHHYLGEHYRRQVERADGREAGLTARPDLPLHYYLGQNDNRRMSPVSQWLLNNYDVSGMVKARRQSYMLLHDLLADAPGAVPAYPALPEGICPLVLPLIITERDRVCVELNREGISAIPWWYGYHPGVSWEGCGDACYLKDHLLALRINEDITREGLRHTARVLRCCLEGFAVGGGNAPGLAEQ
jgi:hypothetical protein